MKFGKEGNLISETFVAQVISSGRVTIPDDLRQLMDIKDGDYVKLEIKQVNRRRLEE